MEEIVNDVDFKDWVILLKKDGTRPYLQITFLDNCVTTGGVMEQHCRKWNLSYHRGKNEIGTTAFKAVMAAMEHEVREHLTYKNRAVFNPHFDMEHLIKLIDQGALDTRKPKQENKNEQLNNRYR